MDNANNDNDKDKNNLNTSNISTFEQLRKLQTLLKRESAIKELCKIIIKYNII